MDPLLVYILITLVFSFFFSGIEIAFVSANKLQIELQGSQGLLSGKILAGYIKKPSRFIGTTLIGNTISLVLYGMLMAQLIEPVLSNNLPDVINNDAGILISQTVISTILVLFTAEFVPKSIFLINPNAMLRIFALPFLIISYLLYPLVFIIVGLSKLVIIHILRLDYSEERPVFGLTDLNHYLKNMTKVLHADEQIELDKKIFHNALEFKTVRVRECMVPRTEIVAVDITEEIDVLRTTFVESGHSKILIYRDSIDDIIGYCHSLELFKKPKSIEELLSPIIIVPETMLVNELMIQFITEHKSLAVVVDEFGGTSGVVSMEDIIEEIFGEIEDEHDEDDLVEQQLNPGSWLLSARLEIDYLNEKYGWNLPHGEYETLGGLILSIAEDFPEKGEKIDLAPYHFNVQSKEGNRLIIIRMDIDT
jgi:putative hemolysin